MHKIFELMQEQVPYMIMVLALVIVAMVIDLITGIRKAKISGQATTSNGLRKTCQKAIHYFVPLCAISVIDLLLSIIPQYTLPWGTLGYGLFCAGTEFFSVFENTHTKDERESIVKSISSILIKFNDREELIKEISKQVLESDKPKTKKRK